MKKMKSLARLASIPLLIASMYTNAELLNLPQQEPIIEFGATGLISYDKDTGLVVVSGVPASLFITDPFVLGEIAPTTLDDEKFFTIQFHVDQNGNIVSGVNDEPDLVVKGSIDVDFDTVPEYDGVLLEAEVAAFGFAEGGATDDRFDIRLNQVTGVLAPLFQQNDLLVNIVSEISSEFPNAFNGGFSTSFSGLAKGNISATQFTPPPPTACHIDVNAGCSVKGMASADLCRIKVNKSSKFWQHKLNNYNGNVCRKSKYGWHGQSQQWWDRNSYKEDVKFTYVITNTGTTTITNILVDDSFETAVAGVPTSLAPGQSVTLMRTEKLNEEIENKVDVFGKNGAAECADSDIVEIQKLKKHSGHHHHGHHDKDDDNDDRDDRDDKQNKKKRWSFWW